VYISAFISINPLSQIGVNEKSFAPEMIWESNGKRARTWSPSGHLKSRLSSDSRNGETHLTLTAASSTLAAYGSSFSLNSGFIDYLQAPLARKVMQVSAGYQHFRVDVRGRCILVALRLLAAIRFSIATPTQLS
jgi:hypothetical protein